MEQEILKAIQSIVKDAVNEVLSVSEERIYAAIVASERRTAEKIEPMAEKVDYIAEVLEGTLHLQNDLEERVKKLEQVI